MEVPVTAKGNRYIIVFQDLFTKWPLVFAASDQKAIRIAKLLAEELVSMFGCPECRGTNLLANVMQDVCKLMGVTKLNTTAYHPQCDGLVERMNRTLKAILPPLESNGIPSFQASFGHTEICCMRLLKRSLRFCFLD